MSSESTPVDATTVALVAGLSLLSTAAAAYEIAPASVIPLIRSSLDIGPAAASWLLSVMYGVSVVASVPLGMVLDRVSVRRAITVAGLALLVAGGWGWLAAERGDYASLIASRVLGGICYLTFWNAGANVVGSAVGADRRATAVGIFTASAPVGFALGQFGSPLIAARYGWPAIFPAFASIAVVGVVVFLVATHRRSLAGDGTATPDWASVRGVFANRSVWLLSTLSFVAFSLYLFFNSWLPSYLTESLGVSLATAGLLTAVFPAVGIVSRTASGLLSDRVFGGRRRPVAVVAFAATLPAVVAFAFVANVTVVVAGLVLAGFTVQLVIGLLYSYVPEIVAPEIRTTALSVLTSVGLVGGFVAPLAGGILIDVAGYQPAFLVTIAVTLGGLLLALRAPEPRPS